MTLQYLSDHSGYVAVPLIIIMGLLMLIKLIKDNNQPPKQD